MEKGMKRSRFLALGLALIALVFVACGGNGAKNASGDGDIAPLDQQVLRLRLNGEPKTIDPQLANIVSETTLSKPLFAGLFTYDKDLNIIPNVATEIPTVANKGVSDDGMTYTIHINKDAKWSDGRVVGAADFVYSMQRAMDPKTASPYASFFYGIAGAQDYNQAMGTSAAPKNPSAADLAALRAKVGVSAKDERTVVYQLTQPNPSFLNLLALWTAFPVRQDIVERYGDKWTEPGNHVGNGPFVLREWNHDQSIVFEPNPFWSGEKPTLQRIEIKFIADDAAAYAAYLNGELDETTVPPAARREVATPGSQQNLELVRSPELSTFALMMNNKAAPFDNAKVRQAFGMAIDRNALVDAVLQGAGRPTTSWIPPGMPGYNGDLGKNLAFDPAKAKQLLAEAGYPNGQGLPPVTFVATASDTNRIQGQFIEDQLKRNLGVEVTTEYVDSKTFGTRFTANQYQATIQRWAADWPYPDNWLPDQFGTGKLNNHVVYSNPKFDDLMTKAAAETDDRKRLGLYNDGQKLMLDDVALVPLYNRENFILVKPNVKNLIITGLDGAIKGDYNFAKTYITAD